VASLIKPNNINQKEIGRLHTQSPGESETQIRVFEHKATSIFPQLCQLVC